MLFSLNHVNATASILGSIVLHTDTIAVVCCGADVLTIKFKRIVHIISESNILIIKLEHHESSRRFQKAWKTVPTHYLFFKLIKVCQHLYYYL